MINHPNRSRRAVHHIDGDATNNDLANLRMIEIASNPNYLCWSAPMYSKRYNSQVADLTGVRYCVKRKTKGSREFWVLRNGTCICEAPSMDSGKDLAQRHANGEWK